MEPDAISWSKLEAGGWPGKGREGDTSPSQGRRDDGREKMEGGRWKMEEGCRTPSKRLAHGTWAGGKAKWCQKVTKNRDVFHDTFWDHF